MPVAQGLCRWEHGVFTRETCIHFRKLSASKYFAAIHETFSIVYEKEVPNKTMHRLVKIGKTGNVCL